MADPNAEWTSLSEVLCIYLYSSVKRISMFEPWYVCVRAFVRACVLLSLLSISI